jgi:nucleotide-binding universal stress UspA family protein
MKTDLIVIAVQTTQRAEIISAKLGSAGIASMLDKVDVQIDPAYAGVKVLVNESDLERAMELLAELNFIHGSDQPLIEKAQDEIVTIAVSTWQKAELMHEMLESAGIASALLNVNLLQSGVSAGVKLRVFEADVTQAMEIIGLAMKEEIEPRIPEYAMGEILLPVDFSEESFTTGYMAAKLAIEADVPLRLLHAHFTPILTAMPFEEATYSMQGSVADLFKDTDKMLLQNMEQLENQISSKLQHPVRPLKTLHTLIRGLASDAILDFAQNANSGMIVISKGLHDDRTGLFMGSVSGKVAERASVPVLVIPNKYHFDGLFQIKNIAYAPSLDDSDHKALQRLWATTRYFAANYHFLHVSVAGELEMDAVKMNDIAEEFSEISGKDVQTHSFQNTDILSTFNRLVVDQRIDLLAVTTHRRNAITQLLYPSLTQRILLHTKLPLLVFHA